MFKVFFRWALMLSAVFAGLMGIIRAQPRDDHQLRELVDEFLIPPEGCPMPCWNYIRPGETSFADALVILDRYRWAINVEPSPGSFIEQGYITWTWVSSKTSGGAYRGEIRVRNNVVQSIRVQTIVSFGDVWLAFKPPEKGAILPSRVLVNHFTHFAGYENGQVQIRTVVPNPLRQQKFWGAQAEIWMLSPDYRDIALYDYILPCWLACP